MELDGLGAELAASGCDGDVSEALRAELGGWWCDSDWREFFQKVLSGDHEEEVDYGGDEEKVDDGGEEVAVADLASVDVTDEIAEVGFADDRPQERIDDLFCQGGHDGGERGSDDDGDGQVDHIATQDEVAESFEHEFILLEGSSCIEQFGGCSFQCGEYIAVDFRSSCNPLMG